MLRSIRATKASIPSRRNSPPGRVLNGEYQVAYQRRPPVYAGRFWQLVSRPMRSGQLAPLLRAWTSKGLRNGTGAGGATAHEIASVTGHQSLEEIERYTRRGTQPPRRSHDEKNQKVNIWCPAFSTVGQSGRRAEEHQRRSSPVALPRGLEPLFSP